MTNIDDRITVVQNSLSLYPRSHFAHIIGVQILRKARFGRYTLSRQKEDLDKSIVHCTEAILLPPVSRDGCHLDNVFQLLFHLARALLERFEKFKQPEDVTYSIEYLRYLRGLLDSFDLRIPKNGVTTSLIRALGIQVEVEPGDGTQEIKEMVALSRELLISTSPAGFPNAVFTSLNEAVEAEFFRGHVQLVNQVIEFLRDAAKMYSPDSHHVFFALARALCTRFVVTHSNSDYEEATTLLEWTLDPNQRGECPDPMRRDIASALATQLAFVRSAIFENPQHSEEAISRLRTILSSPSVDGQLVFNSQTF